MLKAVKNFLVCFSLIFGACTAPFEPQGAKAFTPPQIYKLWFIEISDCAGIWLPYSPIHWYEVDGWGFDCPAYNGRCSGWWNDDRIYLVSERLDDSTLVMHEMLHYILQSGHNVKADSVFNKCGVLEWMEKGMGIGQ